MGFEDLHDVDLLDIWSSGSTLTETLFPDERNTMYQHTITIVVSGLAKAPESLADALRWEATYQGFTVDGGYPKIETKEVVNPNARITHNRLREYHAKMRSMGINASPGRHVVIRGALGFDVDKASALTNAQFDKVMAALNA